jgi:hypothetical protein
VSAIRIIEQLGSRRVDISVSAAADRLRNDAPAGTVTRDLRSTLAEHCDELVAVLIAESHPLGTRQDCRPDLADDGRFWVRLLDLTGAANGNDASGLRCYLPGAHTVGVEPLARAGWLTVGIRTPHLRGSADPGSRAPRLTLRARVCRATCRRVRRRRVDEGPGGHHRYVDKGPGGHHGYVDKGPGGRDGYLDNPSDRAGTGARRKFRRAIDGSSNSAQPDVPINDHKLPRDARAVGAGGGVGPCIGS